MFLLFVFDESRQNSSLLTFENGFSITTVLCVVVVTVSLVLTTLLCICLKRTSATSQITAEQPLAVVADAPLSSSQLQLATAESEAEVKRNENHVSSDRNSNEVKLALSERASSPVQVSVHQFLVVQESTAEKNSSPQLPPRNPHRLLSGQASYSGNPGQLPGSVVAPAAAASGPPPSEVNFQTESLQTFPENVDYEEVDFRPSSVAGQRQTTVADRQYDYIDLKVVKAADESGASRAEVGENSESSASSPRADAAIVSRADSDTPRYAKVDKARDRHTFSATLLENASAKAANSEVDVAGSLQSKNSGSLAALYTEVKKPKSVETARRNENAVPSEPQSERLLAEDASRHSCAGSRPSGSSSDFVPQLTSRNFEEPGYSMIKDELPKTFEDPGYSEIKDEPKQRSEHPGYSAIGEGCSGKSPRSESDHVISDKSENFQNDGAAANAFARGSTVAASASFSREPLYEDIKFDKS